MNRNTVAALAATFIFKWHILRPTKWRRPNIDRQREYRSAEYYIDLAEKEGSFLQEYGMTVDAFRKLANLLRDKLSPKRHAPGSALDVESKILMALRYFRGGSFWDVVRKHGISRGVFYKHLYRVMDAIDATPSIGKPKWPTTKAECDCYATEWEKLSGPSGSRGLFKTVIAMLDGILIKIKWSYYHQKGRYEVKNAARLSPIPRRL
jgi:hypothetical protein